MFEQGVYPQLTVDRMCALMSQASMPIPLPCCPKCGGEPVVRSNDNGFVCWSWVQCAACPCRTFTNRSKWQAIQDWKQGYVQCESAAGESSPTSHEVTQEHGLTTPSTPTAAAGEDAPGADSVLLPCPFCGEQPHESHRLGESLWSHNEVPWYTAMCRSCDVLMEECDDHDELVTRWNRRHYTALHPAPEIPKAPGESVEPTRRHDLEGRLPVVYCGKPVEEWYSQYCQAVMKLSRLQSVAKATAALLDAIEGVQDWSGTEVGDRIDKLGDALKEV
jgi:Lar family restriction alleviation protein